MSSLVQRAKKGDKKALTELIKTHEDFAFNLAYRIVNHKEDAKDVVQQSFLIVLENLSKFRSEAKFSTWLYRIVYNESVKWVKQRKHDLSCEAIVDESVDETEDLATNSLNQSISRLRENEKNIILLFYMAEKSIKEIAKITGLKRSNVKVLLHRGRKNLKKQLTHELTNR